LEFRVLGPLEVSDDGRVIALGGQKQRALLALLLLHANEVVSRDRLIDELWEADPPETARTALQVHISQLRKAVGRERILTQAPGYRAVVEPGELDLERFEQLVRDGADAGALREALALWRGSPLAELGDSFARVERGRLEEQRLLALERRIDADLALGRHAELVPELEGLVGEHPLREHLRGQLMTALYRCGRQADALEVYRRGRRLLSEELGLEPGEELRNLERAILAQDQSLAAPARQEATRKATGARWSPQWLLVAVLGVALLAGALVTGIVLGTGDSSPVPVRPNSVAALDARSGKVVADVPIGGSPIAIALGARSAWVADGDHSTVSRIDVRSKERLPIGGLGSDVQDLAFGYGSLWVAGGNDGTLLRLDPQHNGIERVPLGKAPGAVPQPVFSVRVGVGAIWVMRGNEVLRVDPGRESVTGHYAVTAPQGIAVGLGSLWITTNDERVLRVDARTMKLVYAQDVSHIAYFPVVTDGSLWVVAVPSLESEVPEVWRLDPGTLAQTTSIGLARQFPYQLSAGDGVLWWVDPTNGAVSRLDPRTNRAATLTRLPSHPVSVAAAGGAVWVGVQAEPVS
jgi:DNA-binding SARP family transcriptional activator